MAIKKVSNTMKIITIIIAISMLIPIAIQAYAFFANRETKTVMMTVNGQKIYKEDFEEKYSEFSKKLEQVDKQVMEANKIKEEDYKTLPEELKKEYILSALIREALNKSLNKELGVKVSKKDINEKYTELETQVGGSANLVAALNSKGETVENVRKQIEAYLADEKKLELIKEKINVSDVDIENHYKQLKFSQYEDKSFEEVKEEVKQELLDSLVSVYEMSLLENAFNTATYKFKDESIEPIFNKLKEEYFSLEEYKYTNYDLVFRIVNFLYDKGKGYYEDFDKDFKDMLKTELERYIRIKDRALEAGLELNKDLLPKYQLFEITDKYVTKLTIEYRGSDEELKAIFEQYGSYFDIKHTVSGEIIGKVYKPTSEDDKETKLKVEELMKTINKDNFTEKAKELSKDPGSASNGGSLGTADINNFVPEFKAAVQSAKVGEIVGPVKTDYGYHVIYVESKDEKNPSLATLSHILFSIEIGEKTKEETKADIDKIKDEISSGKLKWEDIANDKTDKYKDYVKDSFSKLEITSQLPLIGYNKEINDKLFSANVGEFLEFSMSDSYVLIQKTEDIPYRKVTFEEVKEKLNFLAAQNNALKVLNEI